MNNTSAHNDNADDDLTDDESEEIDPDHINARRNVIEDLVTSVDCLMTVLPAIRRTLRQACKAGPMPIQTPSPYRVGTENADNKPSMEPGLHNQLLHAIQPPELGKSLTTGNLCNDYIGLNEHYTPDSASFGRYFPTPPTSERSSTEWLPEDDNLLWDARENRKLDWPQTAELLLGKTPNACRRRYERLKPKRAPDERKGPRFEALAKVYVRHREEMWKKLAEELGDRETGWETLEEQVCLNFILDFLIVFSTSRAQVSLQMRLLVSFFHDRSPKRWSENMLHSIN